MEIEPAVPVGSGTDGSEMNIDNKGREGGSDPWYQAIWLECVVWYVLYPDEGGELGEVGNVEEGQLCVYE